MQPSSWPANQAPHSSQERAAEIELVFKWRNRNLHVRARTLIFLST